MFAGKKSAQIREILISESAWEEMTCLFAPSLTNFPILKVFVFGGVTYGLISCIIPGFIILKNDKFSDLRGVSVYYVILIGMLMCIGPFVMLFSQ